jgi:two-component system, NtrC family, nitrogen regulation sensor histidine kinase NtrY
VDADQIEQMLINLVRNAVEAALEPSLSDDHPGSSKDSAEVRKPQVTLNWVVEDQSVILTIEDNGLGLLNPSNAFVPFYTTKPSGSGIGLALSRQIVEAHGGSIELSNLNGKRGCQVRVRLPCR